MSDVRGARRRELGEPAENGREVMWHQRWALWAAGRMLVLSQVCWKPLVGFKHVGSVIRLVVCQALPGCRAGSTWGRARVEHGGLGSVAVTRGTQPKGFGTEQGTGLCLGASEAGFAERLAVGGEKGMARERVVGPPCLV